MHCWCQQRVPTASQPHKNGLLQVGEMWQNASEEEKSPYVAMSNQDKARYQAELEAYNFRSAFLCAWTVSARHEVQMLPSIAGSVLGAGQSWSFLLYESFTMASLERFLL